MSGRMSPTNIEQYRRRKRRAGNLRWLLVSLLFAACAAGGYFFSISPFFGVEQVIVSGNELASAARLRELSGIELGRNIFTVDTSMTERWIMMEPLVETARVELRLPRTVRITVTERQAAAVLATGQAFVQVDKSGLVLRRMRELDSSDLPILSGVGGFSPGVTRGSRIEGESMAVALAVLNSLPEQAFPAVKEIDVTDSQKIRLFIEGGIEVRVGDANNMAEKYFHAGAIIYDAQINGTISNIDYIEVSSIEKRTIKYRDQ